MSDSVQINVRWSPKERNIVQKAARFEKQSVSAYIRDAALGRATGDLVTQAPDTIITGDPLLERIFADDKSFNLLEWVTDEPGRGESSMTVGAKVRGATLTIMDTILQDPRCPYATRSDYIRDAVLTLAYIIARGRFLDPEAAKYAAIERQRAKAIQVQETRNALVILLRELRTYVDEAEDIGKTQRTIDGLRRLAKLIDEDVTAPVSDEADNLALQFYKTVKRNDPGEAEKIRARYPEIIERLMK